jgi:hypothetical protein
MDKPTLRLLIQKKITDGRLPQERLPSMWGGRGAGEDLRRLRGARDKSTDGDGDP